MDLLNYSGIGYGEMHESSDVTMKKKSRKRKSNPSAWPRNIRKQKRVTGEGKAVCDGQLCAENCRRKCSSKISMDVRQRLFTDFYSKTYDQQQQILFGCIEGFTPVQKRKSAEKHHAMSFRYRVKVSTARCEETTVIAEKVYICKIALMNIFQVKRKRIDLINAQVKEGNVTAKDDGRGKHANRPNKIDDSIKENIKTHIKQFPSVQSHYSRSHNPYREYLSPTLSLAKMYRDYVNSLPQKEKDPMFVKQGYYNKVFSEDFNLGFGSPKSDTCSVCDMIDNTNITSHLEDVKQAGIEMKADREEARSRKGTTFMCFDLQQTMPLPKLSMSIAFYLRQVWFYNLVIHMVRMKDDGDVEENGFMFSWVENEGGRGPDEILLSLHAFFLEADIRGDKLLAWSDSCGG